MVQELLNVEQFCSKKINKIKKLKHLGIFGHVLSIVGGKAFKD